MSITQQYAKHLIALESVTPDDAGCQQWIGDILKQSEFKSIDYSQGEVVNTLYVRDGQSNTEGVPGKHLLFLGHTDVVPPGPLSEWLSPPFEPVERAGYLFGRGAADMKGGVAAMISACQAFALHYPEHEGRLSLLLTSDEEGPAMDGVRAVLPRLQNEGLLPDYCLVGEPSSLNQLGDNIRIGRRGSIQGRLQFFGVQGHTAYASAADNPSHRALAALQAITTERFDEGDENFPPTIIHISNLHAGTGATNVTPGHLEVKFNIRNSPASPAEVLRERVEALLVKHDAGDYKLDWHVSGEPFITHDGELVTTVMAAVEQINKIQPKRDTGGGTSDARFFGAAGCQVVELGLINKTIHQANESTLLTDLDRLHAIYYECIRSILVK